MRAAGAQQTAARMEGNEIFLKSCEVDHTYHVAGGMNLRRD
jgi:hypothetical protein